MNLRISTVLSLLLLGASTLHAADDPKLEIVTSFSKSGGIYGDGKLDFAGSKVNGRVVCPEENTNANNVPGCDMSFDTGYYDNNTSDPTDDTYSGDLIVRTSDIFEMNVGWSVLYSDKPVTISSTLTSPALRWDTLPSSCKTGSSISEDGSSMECVRSGYPYNGVSYSEDLPFHIKVKANTPNGTTTGVIDFTVSTEGADDKSDDTDNTELIITAAPKWNVQKKHISTRTNQTVRIDGEDVNGSIIRYAYVIEADEVYGEEDSSSAVLGNEALKDTILNFTDDVSQISPNAKLMGCDIVPISGEPYPYRDGHPLERSTSSLKDNLNVTCNQPDGAGKNISIEYSGIDMSLSHVATHTLSGSIMPLTRMHLGSGVIDIFVPTEDIKNASYKGNDVWRLDTNNTITNFDPISISDQSNFGNDENPDIGKESLKDNTVFVPLYYYGPGYVGGNFYKYFMKDIDHVVPLETVTNGWHSADGIVTPERRFGARVHFSNTGNKDFNNTIICDIIDRETYSLAGKAKPYWNTTALGEDNYAIEYATEYVGGSWTPDLKVKNSAKVIEQCSDANIEWKDYGAVQNDMENITMVRLRIDNGVPHKKTVGFLLDLEARSNYLTSGNIIPSGTELVNYSAVRDSIRFANDNTNDWYGAYRVLRDYPNSASSGYKADRAILMRAIVRTSKKLSTSITEPSEEVEVTIHSTFTTDYTSAEKADVNITELLDKGLKYVIGSANIGDPIIGTCNDLEAGDLKDACTADQQVLIWNLINRRPNEELEDIVYRFSVGAVTRKGTNHTYTIISSPTDTSKIDVRKANKNITVNIPSALVISKEVETPFVPLNTEIEFTSYARNGSSKNLTNLDIIDILPFNDDGQIGFDYTVGGTTIKKRRNQPTAFTGTLAFTSVSGGEACENDVTWRYTNRDPREMNISPSNQTGTTWCAGTASGPDSDDCGFDNSAVTAVRLSGPSLGADGICSLNIKLLPNGNKKGDIYTNTTSAFATGVSLSVLSNDVSAIVPTTLLGDYVWFDYNKNGIQDVNEIGADGIDIKLLDVDDAELKSTTTDDNGRYIFDELEADKEYKVKAIIPSYYGFTTQGVEDFKKDSDVDVDTGITTTKILNVNQQYRHLDIGIISNLIISGKAYKQEDNSSMDDMRVELYRDENGNGELDDNDTIIASRNTGDSGDNYEFTNVFNGDYIIHISGSKEGYTLESDDTLSFRVNGESIVKKDFRYNKIPKSQDVENGEIANTSGPVDIEDLSATDDRDIDHFVIKNLPDPSSGTLYLADGTVVNVGAELTSDQAKGLKFDPNTGFMGNVWFNYTSVDADEEESNRATVWLTILGSSTISNLVWYDTNHNGIQDSGESGIEGITLKLLDANGNIVKNPEGKFENDYIVVTDVNGSYSFEKLSDGNYTVEITEKKIYALIDQGQGLNSKDSDFNTSTFKTDVIVLSPNENNQDVDAGLFVPTVSGHLYHDGNGNQIIDGELADKADGNKLYVTLIDSTTNRIVASKAIDPSGNYLFDITDGVEAYRNYTIVLSDIENGTALHLPNNWSIEGRNNGQLPINVRIADIVNLDFGINKKPVAHDRNETRQFNPTKDVRVVVPTFDIVDAEDGSPTTIVITEIPTNAKLYFKGQFIDKANLTFHDVNQSDFMIDPNDGDLNVTFKYKTIDRGGLSSDEATVIIPFDGLKISGAVYKDGNNNGKVDGTKIDDSMGLWVRLIDDSGTILASKAINELGEYMFDDRDGLLNDSNYTLILTTENNSSASLPEGWNNADGEQIGLVDNSLDSLADGKIEVDVLTVDIPNINFGINERPIAKDKTIASMLNPGGEERVVLPPLEITDSEDTIPTTIKIVTTPIDGRLYYNGVLLEAGDIINDYNSTLLKLDPDAGEPTVEFTYLAIDTSGTESNIARVTYPFSGISISGNLYSDGNNDGIINGTKIDNVNGEPVYVTLLSSTGKVIASTQIDNTGAYSFSVSEGKIEPNRSYQLVISTIADQTTSTLPSNWNHFDGEGIGAVDADGIIAPARSDDTMDGIVSVDVADVSVPEINFGINQQSVAEDKMVQSQLNPGKNEVVVVPTLHITDREDDTPSTVTIKKLPTNGTLYYDGVEITSPLEIVDFNNSKLTVDPIDGEQVILFTYTTTDSTGFESREATVTMSFRGIKISGNIFDDGNVDGDVNGVKISKAGDTPLFVNLLDSNGNLISSYPLAFDDNESNLSSGEIGEYGFDGNDSISANTDYRVILTTEANSTTPLLPDNWNNRDGENIGLTGLDGVSDGAIDVNVSTMDIININFGINERPTTENVATPLALNPNSKVPVVNLLAEDREDGVPYIVTINTLPKFGTLYYDDVKVIAEQNITDFNNSKLVVLPSKGNTAVVFTYSATDITGWSSIETSRVRMPFYVPAPTVVPSVIGNVEQPVRPIVEPSDEEEIVEEDVVEEEEESPAVILNLDITDDAVESNVDGAVTTINVLGNDTVGENVTIELLDLEDGEILWNNGTAVGGTNILTTDELYVPGEGTWRVVGSTVTFTAEEGFTGTPTPIYYLVKDEQGNQSNVAELSISTPCACKAYVSKSSDSVSALGNIGIFVLLIIQMLSVLLVFRKEEELA